MTLREEYENRERQFLSQYACKACDSVGRDRPEPQCDMRTVFQRDRDRIIHSKAFRRLKQKTQVFLYPEGDHYRTRLTHTLEVSQIARTIARALSLNEDLTEAIALGHDLGHTPFGHAGERALNAIVPKGFTHYEQSLRVVEVLENEGNGLNLTFETRDGILRHTTGQEAKTAEGRVVRWADKIAYMNHDIDDAVRAGVIGEDDIPKEISDVFGSGKTPRITSMITAMVRSSKNGDISMDSRSCEAYFALREFMYSHVYTNEYAKKEEKKVPRIIESLYNYFSIPEHLPESMVKIADKEGPQIAACDCVAGMTDSFAVEKYKDLFIPRAWEI